MSTHLVLSNSTQKIDLTILKVLFPAIFGTIVEYYDYALYGFFASLLASRFFPTADPSVALLKTFGIFLAGSLSKPIGAIIFGHIGDRFGRQLSLKISMVGIIIPTLLIGLMPTYDSIGYAAPLFLFICRILQGMFTSGESDGVRIFIYETIGKNRPFLANSLSGIACMFGIYLASCAFSVTMRFEEFSHAWRFPFLIGGLLGLLVFWSRSSLTETPPFIQHLNATTAAPRETLLAIISKNKQAMFTTILLCGSVGGIYHFYLVFFGHYVSHTLQLVTPTTAALYTAEALLIFTICGPLSGILADRFGPIRILKISLIGLSTAVILNTIMIDQGVINVWIFWATTILVSFFSTPGFVVLLQQFSVSERCRCLSIGHAIGSMLFSGSAPVISLWFWYTTKIAIAPMLYFSFLILMGFLALFMVECDEKDSPLRLVYE